MADIGGNKPIRLLVIDGHHASRKSPLLKFLSESQVGNFETTQVTRLSKALDKLRHASFDAILMNLSLPDSLGMDTFLEVYSHASDIPILVVSGQEDKAMAVEVIREGAQDFLVKDEINPQGLARAISFAIERNQMRAMLHYLSLNDELTDLFNRRGFLSLAAQQMKIARREHWQLLLIFADLDGLKTINDRYGHPEGDQALRAVASILKETFRISDVIARLGGDEFIVLAINFSQSGVEVVTNRLQENVDRYNAGNQRYQISLSYGVLCFDPRTGISLEKMIAKADQALYAHKRSKKR